MLGIAVKGRYPRTDLFPIRNYEAVIDIDKRFHNARMYKLFARIAMLNTCFKRKVAVM